MEKKLDQKTRKKRNYYFGGFEKKLAEKHNIPQWLVNEIRRFAIHRKMTQQGICLYITDRFNNGDYEKFKKSTQYKTKTKLIKIRSSVLKFLLHCPTEDFKEITQLTKYDYDFEGENKQVPSREELQDLQKRRATL